MVSTTGNTVVASHCLRNRLHNVGIRVPARARQIEEELPEINLNIVVPENSSGGDQIRIEVEQTQPAKRPNVADTPQQDPQQQFGNFGEMPGISGTKTVGRQSLGQQGIVDIGGGRQTMGGLLYSDTNDEDVIDDGPEVKAEPVNSINPFQTGVQTPT
ncbi:MAG: hypothetical protein MJK18_09285, partial [Bdellovibrionales bacterium]|nr:hypothetical protein [Bdellovibrionales bacterium]